MQMETTVALATNFAERPWSDGERRLVMPLRQWRTRQLYSLRQLADDAGITTKTLTDIEYGRRRPTYDTMRSISRVLGISAHDVEEFLRTIEARSRCE